MIKVRVEKLIFGGKGLAKIDGKVCFVPYVLPDEEVEVEIQKEKKDLIECSLKQVLKPSPYRVDPVCVYFTRCGGCDYLHIQYDKQVEIKNEIFRETLQKIGKLDSIPLEEPVKSPQIFYYRNRVQFKVQGDKVGFYEKNSNKVVDIDGCMLINHRLNLSLDGLKKLLELFYIKPSQVHIHGSNLGQIAVKFIFPRYIKSIPVGQKHIKHFLGDELVGYGMYYQEGKKVKKLVEVGSPFVYERLKNYLYRVSINSFFQVNPYQTENLIDMVEEVVKEKKPEVALDLYCGVGTFSIPMAKHCKKVFGVEISQSAVNDANHNRKQNRVNNLFFKKADASKVLDYIQKKNPDLVLVDPPRKGLDKQTIQVLNNLKNLKTVIYISCNPSTLARDITLFKEGGFNLKSTKMVDMFPHTHHIESFSVLERV
ncbi:MAG: class I SAM-dependent RNA methyltransferase [Aquificae bacterium]|nr:class I SAM-dependent RNA methyltransferase [Aquificota bacterium]